MAYCSPKMNSDTYGEERLIYIYIYIVKLLVFQDDAN